MMKADVVVVGGGPAGCAAAIGLARAGARVILCSGGRNTGCKPGEIVDAAVRIPLAELGIADSFNALNSLVLAGNLSLWDSETPVVSEGIMSPYGHGALIDRPLFDAWLLAAATGAGVDVIKGGKRLEATLQGPGWHIRAEGVPVIDTPLIVEATGRSQGVLGHGQREESDQLVALLFYGATRPGPRDQRLLIEASEYGWWYAAPLPGNEAVIAFLTDIDLLPATAQVRRDFVSRQLIGTKLIEPFSKQMQTTSRTFGYPASSSIRCTINGVNWVAVGEAAATYDPLSGHGVAAALAKGASIARLITNGENLSGALEDYAAAERSTFATYLAAQRATYRRAAPRFGSAFWNRRR